MLREQRATTAHYLLTLRDPMKILNMFVEGSIEYMVKRYLALS